MNAPRTTGYFINIVTMIVHLLYAHLAWLVAWLSCLPCRNWSNIIIIWSKEDNYPSIKHVIKVERGKTKLNKAERKQAERDRMAAVTQRPH
jgi:hypothetical protein